MHSLHNTNTIFSKPLSMLSLRVAFLCTYDLQINKFTVLKSNGHTNNYLMSGRNNYTPGEYKLLCSHSYENNIS